MANGTDDYVNKPFGIGELLARIRAASRYHQRCQGQEKIITLGALKIDAGKHEVLKNGVALHLTPKVFDLL
jgi:two-component system KDP operon response regulator KdpE